MKARKNWTYRTDPETGLSILASKKDPKALQKIRKLADSLFKDWEKRGRLGK
jgi:hypothetical protein